MATYTLKEARERLEKYENSWEVNAPEEEFGDITLDDVKDSKKAFDAREDKIADTEALLKRLRTEHKQETKADMKKLDYVSRAVEGDRRYGPDSPLYGGFGYILESEKKRGGGRKKTTPTT